MASVRDLQPWLAPYAEYLLDVAAYNRLTTQVTSVVRSREAQANLYQRWLNGLSDLPAAPPGTSLHELGLAFDLVVSGDYRGPSQAALGAFWKRMGGLWSPKDPVHFWVPGP